ncbi:MAG TPA: hypothetical protein PLE22_00170 [Acidovorax sp.]|nr:hypothetical protein [Acidovorax sp.]
MTEPQAADIANKIIGLLLTHQPDVLGKSALIDQEEAQKAASNIAAFRLKLIQDLTSQPH